MPVRRAKLFAAEFVLPQTRGAVDISTLANLSTPPLSRLASFSPPSRFTDLQKIREVLGPDGADDVFMLGLTWESLGVLLFRREVSLDLMDDLFSGAIIISWRKIHVFVEEDRRITQRDTVWEWFQWLAERMSEREKSVPPVAAHIAHRSWR
jgi:hypothetical protein